MIEPCTLAMMQRRTAPSTLILIHLCRCRANGACFLSRSLDNITWRIQITTNKSTANQFHTRDPKFALHILCAIKHKIREQYFRLEPFVMVSRDLDIVCCGIGLEFSLPPPHTQMLCTWSPPNMPINLTKRVGSKNTRQGWGKGICVCQGNDCDTHIKHEL